MTSSRKKNRPRWFGFEVLEVRRLLTGQPGTISGAILENPVVGAPLTASGLIDTLTHHPTHSTPDLVDFYQVHLAVGQQLSANVSLPTGSHLQSYLRVFNSVPSEVKNGGFGAGPSSLTYTAIASGDYYVGVSDSGTSYDGTNPPNGANAHTFGSYTLTLLVSPPVSDANNSIATDAPIRFIRGLPATVSGAIAYPNDADLFELSLLKGDQLSFAPQAIGSPLAGRLRLFETSPQVQEFTPNTFAGGDPSFGYTIPGTGVYYVGISGSGNASYDPNVPHVPHDPPAGMDSLVGAFNFNLTVNSPAPVAHETQPDDTFDDANSLALGTSVGGTVHGVGDPDFYLFTITSDGQLTVTATPSASSASQLAPRLTLYGLDRQPLLSADGVSGGAAAIQQHLAAGTYYLTVSTAVLGDTAAVASGDYDLVTSFISASDPFGSSTAGTHPVAIARPDANSDLLLDSHGNPIIDLNGDGIPDLVVANQFSGNVSVMLGIGDGKFQPADNYPAHSNASAVAVGDFNHDGHEDVAVANYSSGDVSVLLNNGDGALQPAVNYSVGGQPLGLAVGDFSGDGKLDLAVATAALGSGPGSVVILTGDGHGHFTTGSTIAVGVRPYAIVAARFGHDQFLDLAVANRNSDASSGSSVALGSGSVSILRGKGDGTFQQPSTQSEIFADATAIASWSNNGTDYTITTSTAVDWQTNTKIAFTGVTDSGGSAINGNAFVVTRIDSTHFTLTGAGDAGSPSGGFGTTRDAAAIASWSNDGTDYSITTSRAVGWQTNTTITFTGVTDSGGSAINGHSFVVIRKDATHFTLTGAVGVGSPSGGFGASEDIATIASWSNDGTDYTITTSTAVDWQTNTKIAFTGVADSGGSAIDGNAFVVKRVDSTHFTLTGAGDSGSPSGGIGTTQAGYQPTSLAVGDLTGDGLTDLAVANAETRSVSLLIGQADGAFVVQPPLNLVGEAISINSGGNDSGVDGFRSTVIMADFNSDGRLDLALANSLDPRVRVALQNTDGSFGAAESVDVGDVLVQPQDLLAADFSGNGRIGLAAVDGFGGAVTVRLGLGDGTFQVPQHFDVGNEPNGLVAADFNHDLHSDLAVANDGAPGGASVLMGVGDGTFQPQNRFTTGVSTAIASADFNGDGRPDLVTTNFDPATKTGDVTVLLGLGDGTYQSAVHYAAGNSPFAVVTGDFNGDGRPDIAVVNRLGNNVSVLINNGDGTYQPAVNYAVGNRPDAIAIGDFNGDHHLDLAVADSGSKSVSILLGDGLGGFQVMPIALSVGTSPTGIVVADFGNKRDDIATANSGSGDVSVLMNLGAGNFAPPVVLKAGAGPSAIAAGDFNGDGLMDLAVSNSLSDNLSVFMGLGGGTFAPAVTYAVGHNPSALVAADLNGDGRTDLACTNVGDRDVSVLLGRGDGTFVTPDKFTANAISSTPTLADVTGDGVLDSIALDGAGQILLRPGRNNEPGTFDAARIVNPSRLARAFKIVQSAGRTLIAAVDLDFNTVSLYSTTAAGISTLAMELSTDAQPVRIAAADLRHNGLEDLVVSNAGTGDVNAGNGDLNAENGDVSVFLANAGGGFNPAVTFAATAHPTELALVALDGLNGDQLPDIIVSDAVAGTVSVLVNQGGGNFAPAIHYRATTGQAGFSVDAAGNPALLSADGAGSFAWGDFFGNNTNDLVVVNPGDDSLSLLEGDGRGGFLNPVRLLAGVRTAVVRAGHFFPDGHLDLAVLDADHHTITILRGDGHGNFQTTGQYDAGNLPDGLLIGDFDGNGTSDLIVGNQFGDVMSLAGHGDGTFDPFTRVGQQIAIAVGDVTGNGLQSWVVTDQTRDHLVMQVGGTTPSFSQGRSDGVISPGAAKLVDLNGDGTLDMVVANSGGNDVLVYKGLGKGKFAAPVAFYAGTDPVDVEIGNVDGNKNHLPDVIITNEGSNDVSILLNNVQLFAHLNNVQSAAVPVSAWLQPGPRLNVGLAPVSSQLVPPSGQDKFPSLMVTNSGSNNVFMLPGRGGGFFDDSPGELTVFNTGNSPQMAFIGNFIGLGQALVTVNYLSNSLTIFRGMDPNSRQDIGSGGLGPSAAVTGDFAQNGGLELVVGNSIDGALAIFAGTANGLIETDAIFSESLQHPVALALAAPGEGQGLRLLAADEGDENVRVFSRETVLLPSPADTALATSDSIGSPLGFSTLAVLASALGVAVESGVTAMADGSISQSSAGGASAKLPTIREWLESTVASLAVATRLHDAPDGAIEVLESVLDVAAPQLPWRVLHQFFETLLHASDGSKKSPPKPAVVDQVFEAGGDEEEFDVGGDQAADVIEDRGASSVERDAWEQGWPGLDRREAPAARPLDPWQQPAADRQKPVLQQLDRTQTTSDHTSHAPRSTRHADLVPEIVAALFAGGFALAKDYALGESKRRSTKSFCFSRRDS